jgi:RES domain-containing protein
VASEQTLLPIAGSPGSLTAFRYCDYDVPFWVRRNTRPGRFHELGDAPTQYWALCPEAAWAELIRHEDLHSEADLDLVRMPIWVARVPRAGLIDLRIQTNQDMLGADDEALTADTWGAAQAVAQRLRRDGSVTGIISPSAALPGHANLTLFGARRAVDWHSKPTLASTLSAIRAAIGRPPEGLLKSVRRLSDPQASLF